MKQPTRIILLTVLLLVGRFTYGQEKESSKIIEIDATFRETSKFHCIYRNGVVFLFEYGKGRDGKEYVVKYSKIEEGKGYTIQDDTIQNIPRHYVVKVIGKMEIEQCPEEPITFEMCEIIKHSPIRFKRNYKLDTNVTFDLYGQWKFIGFRNSLDSIVIDSTKYCCGGEPFKFETFDKNDSIFYPPRKDRFGLKFEKNIKNPFTDLDNYYVDSGCDGTYCGYCISSNNVIEFHRECFGISSGGCLSEEEENYERLFDKTFYSTKRYSLNHNILTLYDSISPRQMIFVRDEK